jgi:pimeloyl-ACP methyl ester carboxylesterase
VAGGGPTAGDPTAGGGAPFLLVHGLASNARTWDGVAARLAAAGREVVAIDLRGHGRSSKPDDGYDPRTVAGDLAVAIDELGLGRPVVAGQSWGGNVVLELAAREPGLLGAVVGVDGGLIELTDRFPSWEACAAALAPPRLAGRPLAELETRLRAAHPDWPDEGIAGTLANFEVRADGTIAPWLTYERHMTVLRGLWEHRPRALLSELRVPLALAVAGSDGAEAERLAADVAAVAAASGAPSVTVRAFPATDHDIHAHRPAELAAWLLSIPTGAAPR